MNEWDDAHWFKADASGDHGCVEVAFRGDEVGVRDTKDRTGPVLRFTPSAWRKFASQVKGSLGVHPQPARPAASARVVRGPLLASPPSAMTGSSWVSSALTRVSCSRA